MANLEVIKNSVIEGNIAAAADETKSCLESGMDPMEIIKVANLYAERKLAMGAMDFDDLLVNGLRLLVEHESVRDFYQNRFRHVLVPRVRFLIM